MGAPRGYMSSQDYVEACSPLAYYENYVHIPTYKVHKASKVEYIETNQQTLDKIVQLLNIEQSQHSFYKNPPVLMYTLQCKDELTRYLIDTLQSSIERGKFATMCVYNLLTKCENKDTSTLGLLSGEYIEHNNNYIYYIGKQHIIETKWPKWASDREIEDGEVAPIVCKDEWLEVWYKLFPRTDAPTIYIPLLSGLNALF